MIVHDLTQAKGALAAAVAVGRAIQLRSAPDAAAYAGVGYLKALGDAVDHDLLTDCGDDPGLVMAALRTGCRKLAFAGPGELCERLADMAAAVGAELHDGAAPVALLDLAPEDDAVAACTIWLSKSRQIP